MEAVKKEIEEVQQLAQDNSILALSPEFSPNLSDPLSDSEEVQPDSVLDMTGPEGYLENLDVQKLLHTQTRIKVRLARARAALAVYHNHPDKKDSNGQTKHEDNDNGPNAEERVHALSLRLQGLQKERKGNPHFPNSP